MTEYEMIKIMERKSVANLLLDSLDSCCLSHDKIAAATWEVDQLLKSVFATTPDKIAILCSTISQILKDEVN